MKKFLVDNEIVCKSYENAITIQHALLEEGCVVMLSREEEFWIINWIWDSGDAANRNAVIFLNREDYEWEEYQRFKREGGVPEEE